MSQRSSVLARPFFAVCLILIIGSLVYLLIPNKQKVYIGATVAKTKCYKIAVPRDFSVTKVDPANCAMELAATDGSYSVAILKKDTDANKTDASILKLAKESKVQGCAENGVDQPAAGVVHIDWKCTGAKMDMYAFHGGNSKLGNFAGQPTTAIWLGVVNLKPATAQSRSQDIYQRLSAL